MQQGAGLRAGPSSMKVAYIVPARNKAKHVRRCVESVLAQTYPCEVVLSDQGSTDGTREIMEQMAGDYRGHHVVRTLDCPHLEYRGIPGMNVHINWIMDQTDADVIFITSADDLTHCQRVELTMPVYKAVWPSAVANGTYFATPEGEYTGENANPKASGWVTTQNCLKDLVGGSTSISWTREFFEKIRPLPGVPSLDVFMPFLATLDRGYFYLHDKLHTYITHAGEDNAGLGGVWLAGDEKKKLQVEELMHFQVTTGMYSILSVMDQNGWLNENNAAPVYEQIIERSSSWCSARSRLSLDRVPPLPFNT
jgi:glycosyltransferase involved in cell wall biosynthesis